MELDYNKVNQLLNTLPIGYYLKRKIEVKLSYEESSYYDLYKDFINISYRQLNRAFNNIKVDIFNEKNLEYCIRCLLYHEVSHAFLTPRNITNTPEFNIFEDERIESICHNYYLGVDFKKFVKLICNYSKGEKPNSAIQMFFQIVRFNEGPLHLLKEKDDLLKKYISICASSSDEDAYYYKAKIISFYKKVEEFFERMYKLGEKTIEEKDQKDFSKESDNSSNKKNKEENEDYFSQNDQNLEENEKNNDSFLDNSIDEKEEIDEQKTSYLKNALENAIDEFKAYSTSLNDSNLQNIFSQLLFKKNNFAKQNGSAINAYSGVFDVRSLVREDYKYFVKNNRLGNLKRFSKIKLNLFIDTSGSYYYNESITNKFIYNLIHLEKINPDFSFDVIEMNIGERILDKNNRYIKVINGKGNYLDNEIFNIYKKVQNSQAENYNIVLFDGDALTNIPRGKFSKPHYAKNFKAFNHSNTSLISNYQNKKYIDRYCKNAKSIIVNQDYSSYLINNIIKVLQNIS